jgi:trehalose/maltose hydrolase-like predicted phosphorylase
MKYASLLCYFCVAFCFHFSGFSQSVEPWRLTARVAGNLNYYGVTLGNGMIGLVSSPEPMRVKDVVLNGAFDNYGRGRVDNILKGFNFLNVNLDVDFQRINTGNITGFQQSLDMKSASLITEFDFAGKVHVKQTMLALRHLPYSALSVIEIEARQDCRITPASVIEAPDILREVRNLYAVIDREVVNPYAKNPHKVRIPLMTSVGKSPSGRHTVAASTSFIFDKGEEINLIHEDWDYNMHLAKFSKDLKAGQKFRFCIVGSVISSAHVADAHNEAERLTVFAALEGYDRLFGRHQREWDELWKSDIVIEGDPELQRDVRFMLYHLYSFAREGTAFSLSPMGLSGLGYNGHVFWDTELWMYPPLLALKPELARSLLEYRFQRLQAARENAFSHGFKGAMFPWESASEGQEATPVWALTGPFQHHITGCVGWAFWKYYQVTKDKQWLRDRGYPVLKEVADFWASRVERNGPGKYDIKNVIGANEWEENIDNNAFTNAMAITVLRYATQAATELGLPANPDWSHVAQNIPILKFPDGVTRENATYDGIRIKQADVNLLAFPLEFYTDKSQIEKDLNYYEPRYAPDGPAMGFSVLAAIAARQGSMDRAYDLLIKSYRPNQVPPFGVIAETAGGTNPYFATGAGGTLQTLLFGFAGLRISDAGITQVKGKLPSKWKSIEVRGVGPNKTTFTLK